MVFLYYQFSLIKRKDTVVSGVWGGRLYTEQLSSKTCSEQPGELGQVAYIIITA